MKIEQLGMFDNSVLDRNKPIRLIELFAGYGSQALALKYLGVQFEHWKICEWAVKSIQAYKDVHYPEDNTDYTENLSDVEVKSQLKNLGISSNYNEAMTGMQVDRLQIQNARTILNNIIATKNLVNISQVKGTDLDIVDTDKYNYIVTYSFPCFTADSLVLTRNGYKNINNVEVGDEVITHDNKYHKVVNVFDNGIKPILKIKAMAVDEIKCTPNHKFYTRQMCRVGHKQVRTFSEPEWKMACDLTKNHYLGVAINQNEIIPEWNGIDFELRDGRTTRHKNQLRGLMTNADFWWIVGRYIGDGWIRSQGGVIICCAFNKLDELKSKLDGLFHYSVVKERTVFKVHIALKELELFVTQFGRGAANKHLTNTIIDLPRDLLKAFLEGYISADGYVSENITKITSISRELIYGTAQCVAKVYRTPYKIYHTARPSTHIIENRIVNQHDTYELVWKENKCKQDKAFYENGYIWYPIQEITEENPEQVFDIEVETNHSFTVQNTIVHNCQDLSLAGKRMGMTRGGQTRSGLLWEIERLLKECKELPQMLLMENVPAVIGKKNIADFKEWLSVLESLGYTSTYGIMNATDFGIPQNRQRCFCVSILGNCVYEMPKSIGCNYVLKDFLDKGQIPESYYLTPHAIEYLEWNAKNNKEKGRGFG